MTPCSLVVSVLVVGVMALSGCGGDEAGGLTPGTPTSGTSSLLPVAAPTWTSTQQQVIDTTLSYHAQFSKFNRGARLDMVALGSVDTDAIAAEGGKKIVDGMKRGVIMNG